jgi:hypothetical protein
VRINEVRAACPPDGRGGDWVELYNASDSPVDLSGLFLSDDPDRPRMWRFPEGSTVGPRGFLLVRAGGEGTDGKELLAPFGLSKEGESLVLHDRDDRGNGELDRAVFGSGRQGESQGRFPDGQGALRPLSPTPQRANEKLPAP